jgi:hypothetical protein
LHFHPEVEIAVNGMEAEFRLGEERGTIHALGNGEVAVKAGMYFPEFGRREESTVLEFEGMGTGTVVCGWFVSFGDARDETELFLDRNGRLLGETGIETQRH